MSENNNPRHSNKGVFLILNGHFHGLEGLNMECYRLKSDTRWKSLDHLFGIHHNLEPTCNNGCRLVQNGYFFIINDQCQIACWKE